MATFTVDNRGAAEAREHVSAHGQSESDEGNVRYSVHVINPTNCLKIAEDLYTKGFISYPRTETDIFDRGIDLRKLVEKQVQDPTWGNYAQE